MAATGAWLAAVESLFNRGLESSAEAIELARRLQGTCLRLEVGGFRPFHASVSGGRLALSGVEAGEPPIPAPDATISGSPVALWSLARGTPVVGTMVPARVRGDAETANLYRRLFAAARPDLEEEVSRVVGDMPARRLSRLAAGTLAWAERARRIAGANVAEYPQEESRDLLNKTEMEEFLRGVDSLREMADRVEARVARLEGRLRESG